LNPQISHGGTVRWKAWPGGGEGGVGGAFAGGDDDLPAGRQVTAAWIAERLGMGRRRYLNHLLYRRRKFRREYP